MARLSQSVYILSVRRLTAIAALALNVGCGSGVTVFQELPPGFGEGGVRSALFARARGDEVRYELRAITNGEVTTPVNFLVSEDVQIYAAAFSETLDDLQTQEGLGTVVEDGPLSFELADKTWSASPTDDGLGPWREDASVPAAVRAGRFGTPLVRCPSEVYSPYPLDPVDNGRTIESIGNGKALATTEGGHFWVVAEDGITRRDDLFGLPYHAIHASPSGRIWLGGDDGLYEGNLDEGFVQTRTATETGAIRRLSADPTSERPELFGLTDTGNVIRITDTIVESFPGVTGAEST